MKSPRFFAVFFGFVFTLGASLALADVRLALYGPDLPPDVCRDYIKPVAQDCLYPTEAIDFGDLTVCRCPGSRPCAGRP